MSDAPPPTNYEAIERRAFENYLVELVRETAKEQENLYREIEGAEMPVLIQAVELNGTFPDTTIRLHCTDGKAGRQEAASTPIWKQPTFFDDQGNRLRDPMDIAGFVLTWARGG